MVAVLCATIVTVNLSYFCFYMSVMCHSGHIPLKVTRVWTGSRLEKRYRNASPFNIPPGGIILEQMKVKVYLFYGSGFARGLPTAQLAHDSCTLGIIDWFQLWLWGLSDENEFIITVDKSHALLFVFSNELLLLQLASDQQQINGTWI